MLLQKWQGYLRKLILKLRTKFAPAFKSVFRKSVLVRDMEDKVRENPLAAIGIAMGVGALLSYVSSRR